MGASKAIGSAEMMLFGDVFHYSWRSVAGYPARSILMLLAMAISVASVLVLTALGEGARRYVSSEFASLGTNLVIVLPGRSETAGAGWSTMMGAIPRDLTIGDAEAVTRHPAVVRVAPLVIGQAEVSWQAVSREIVVMGSTSEILDIRHWEMESGSFLPKLDWDRQAPVCVIGKGIRQELFRARAAVGQWLRVGDSRCRISGILASSGNTLGADVEDLVILPVASAQSLFNTSTLFRIFLQVESPELIPRVITFVEDTIQQRHQGERDVTVITQDVLLKTFDDLLVVLTLGVSGIAAVSLAVAGILIMNVMLVAVSQRTAEIGLLKALGASRGKILWIMLSEAMLLSLMGACAGLLLGFLGAWGLRAAVDELQAYPPLWAVFASLMVALLTGILFSLMPSRRAARLDPILALQGH